MQRQEYFNGIEKRLNWQLLRVKSRAKQNILDLNIFSETFFKDLLNLVYDLNLTNLNNKSKNAKAIDLLDDTNKVVFQVTSKTDKSKINDTLDKIGKEYQSYNLKFIFIDDKAYINLSTKSFNQNLFINFNPKNDILDIPTLLLKIIDLNIDKLEKVYLLCKKEIKLENEQKIVTKCYRKSMLSKAQWTHETTNDSRYIEREELINWLNNNVNNPKIRTISIKGIGGTGKTSFIGHWAKVNDSNIDRPLEGLFYWSFYVERDCNSFIESILSYFEEKFNFDSESFEQGRKNLSAIEFFLDNFHLFPPILVILDGLEVLQEDMNDSSYGAFIDSILREFILHVTSARKHWLCITTSRYPLVDIFQKSEFIEKKISGVEEVEGANILLEHGINGHEQDRKFISNYLEGHPLGIKVFSASFSPKQDKNNPLIHFNQLFGGLKNGTLDDKLSKLLWFYKNNISKIQINCLSALSIFRKGISIKVWIDLSHRLLAPHEASDFDIKKSIGELLQIGLVIKDTINSQDMYSCHPIIRDFFNHSLLIEEPQSGIMVAKFLTQSPDSIEITGVASIERFIVSIEALLKSKHEQEAINIYITRLKKGSVFLKLGLPKEAKHVYRMFSEYFQLESRRTTTVGSYRAGRLDIITHFINPYIEYSIQLGDFSEAEKAIVMAERYRKTSVYFRWKANILFQLGDFQKAISYCKRAIEIDSQKIYEKESKIESVIISSFLLYKIYVIINEKKDSLQAKISKMVKLSSVTEYTDFQIRNSLCMLTSAIENKNENKINLYLNKIEDDLKLVQDWYFKLNIQIDLAKAYIFLRNYETAKIHINEVHSKSVKESYPYTLYLSSLLKDKIKYLTNDKSFNIETIVHIFDLSKSNNMMYVSLQAIELIIEINGRDEDFEELRQYYKNKLGLF